MRTNPAPQRVSVNDNRISAGILKDGVLTVRLEARMGEWHPDREADPGVMVQAFGEQGKSPQIPAPLIRVAQGTEIRALVRNALPDSTLVVHGLHARGAEGADTVQIEPGQLREVRFKADVPGTYYYWGATTRFPGVRPRGIDSQLNGAFIVDSAGATKSPADRVMVLGLWSARVTASQVVERNELLRFVINGKAWPNTERLSYTEGDSVRFRIVNTSSATHPMHLHGFYFNVVSRGDELVDTAYSAASPHLVVTERSAPGRTFAMTWVPDRPGNWMFHCHDNLHVLRSRPLDGSPLPSEDQMQHVKNHALEMMGGLVMGIEVRPKGVAPAAKATETRRTLRLVARVDSGGTVSEPAYGYALEDPVEATRSPAPLLPGPTIVLARGEPVSITVVNALPEATSVHWHGIELDSYYDGVAGFAGHRGRIAPAIAPGDSFEARFIPPRAGTFIYHPHVDELRQQQAGLSGALIVLGPRERFDPAKDVVLLLSTPRRIADAAVVLLNGTSTPPRREMRVGNRYRLRLINIHVARPNMVARLLRDSTQMVWRAVAKDGMDLPADQATDRPALQQIGNGETYDFEFRPPAPGEARLTVSSGAGALLVTMPIRMR